MTISEPTMIGLSEATHAKLKRLSEDGHFKHMADAYKFGIGLALAQGVIPPDLPSSKTVFSVATIDPDQTLKNAIQTILGDQLNGISTYKMAERLADWGVSELSAQAEKGEINIVMMFDQIKEKSV
jgi:hypothetical protein